MAWQHIKVALLTLIVVASFLLSSLAWRHIESSESQRILVASAILIGMYALMIFELVNRNLAALIGAAAAVAAHACLVELVNLNDLVGWLDLETLALLLSMMIIVNVLASSNLFDFLAVWCYQKAAGRFWSLIFVLALITCFLSAFVDNVSTMLLMAPTLIKLSELERLDPRPLLIIMVIFSNIGGCATPVGDPPNLIIIGDPLVKSLNISFSSFTAYVAPCVLLMLPITMGYLKVVYKSKESFRLTGSEQPTSQHELDDENRETRGRNLANQQQLKADKGTHLKRQETRIEVTPCSNQMAELRRDSRLDETQIASLLQSHCIKSRPLLIMSLTILLLTVLLFFVQSLPGSNLTLGWISLFAGLTLLVVTSSIKLNHSASTNNNNNNNNPEEQINEEKGEEEDNFELVVSSIEWSTLMFFAALFVVMEVMAKLGLLRFVGIQISNLVALLPDGPLRSAGAITIILWASGLSSALVDNVPFTSMMIKVLGSMALSVSESSSSSQALPIKPLVFALAFGACLGGNGSLIGASANLITANLASRHRYPITFNGFFKFAAPIALLTLITANVYLILVFVVLDL